MVSLKTPLYTLSNNMPTFEYFFLFSLSVRIKKYKEKQHVKNQSKASPKQRQDEQPNVYTNETLDIDYQELGELKKPEIYDTVQQ